MNSTINPFGKWTKIVTLLVGAVIAWVTIVQQSPSAPITGPEWTAALILGATALGVYGGSNAPKS